MPSPNQAKPTASVNSAAPHFLQETFRDSGLSARKEVQPVEELLWGGGRDRERKAEGGGRKGKGRGRRTEKDALN